MSSDIISDVGDQVGHEVYVLDSVVVGGVTVVVVGENSVLVGEYSVLVGEYSVVVVEASVGVFGTSVVEFGASVVVFGASVVVCPLPPHNSVGGSELSVHTTCLIQSVTRLTRA